MTARKRAEDPDRTRQRLIDEAWNIIRQAKTAKNFAAASATLERVARIAGVWSDKSAAGDPDGPPPTLVFTSEPMTPEQWSEKFAPEE